MKLYKADIEKYFGDFIKMESDFYKALDLKPNENAVFFYTINEKEFPFMGNIKIEKKFTINELIYRQRAKFGMEHISILKEPFDTKNLFFYYYIQFLGWIKTYEDPNSTKQKILANKNEIDNVFLKFKANELNEIKKIELNSQISFDIFKRSSLENALSYYILNRELINPLLNITDIVANSYNSVFDREFYGGALQKIVRGMKLPDGKLMPEYGGSMRYIIVGEKSEYVKAEGFDSLAEAKVLKRERYSDEDILLKTGWYLNPYDNLWRKSISDDDFHISQKFITSSDKGDIFEGSTKEINHALEDFFKDKTTINNLLFLGYDNNLEQLIHHPKLFMYYPSLKNLPIIYGLFNAKGNPDYYFSPENPNYIYFKGFKFIEEKYTQSTILLHEIQHAIQNIEGYATGGNQNLAFLIQSVGGNSVRKYYDGVSAIKKYFCEKILYDFNSIKSGFYELKEYIKQSIDNQINTVNEEVFIELSRIFLYLGEIERYFINQETAKSNCISINMAFLIAASHYPIDISNFYNKFGIDAASTIDLGFKNRQDSIKKMSILKSQGWTDRDIKELQRNYYLFLLGETESRYVQHSSVLIKDLQNYFTPYTSEYVPKEYLTIYYDFPIEERKLSAKGALETKDDKYIIHLFQSAKGVEYLHELGHIVFDICNAYFTDMEIKSLNVFASLQDDVRKDFETHEEFFCFCFINYIVRKNFEPSINEINPYLVKFQYDYFDDNFNQIFNLTKNPNYKQLKKALAFVKELAIL
jgi:hypothetical protein